MYRLFKTHQIRKSIELPTLWEFSVPDKTPIKMPVPSCIESIPAFSNYKGKCTFEAQCRFSNDLRLTFKGVGHTANVYLDGQHLGSHYGAYGEFSFVLKNQKDEKHTITVNADNSYSTDSALHIDNDYYSYLGITRPMILEQLDRVYVKYTHITPSYDGVKWKIHITSEIENITDSDIDINVVYFLSTSDSCAKNDDDVTEYTQFPVHIKSGDTKKIEYIMNCSDVITYTPENPYMYFLHCQLITATGNEAIDDLIERFGFREIKVAGKEILFNGTPLKIKGFNRHEDYAEFGCSVPVSAMQRDIMLIKETGANCIRTCHYPNDERFLDLCDENGILVWEESHARGLSEENMLNPNFMEQSKLSIFEMITYHFNHPSIFVWGLLNECASETEYGRKCYEELIGLIRDLDPSKPVTFASCKHFKDICLDLADIVSYNIYPKWYRETSCVDFLSDCVDYIRENGGANKPILISEIGAGAIYGYRTNTRCKWSEEGQVDMLYQQITSVMSNSECSGVIIWQFADCRVDAGWALKRPKTQNNKGVVDMYRREKLGYEKVKELFKNL